MKCKECKYYEQEKEYSWGFCFRFPPVRNEQDRTWRQPQVKEVSWCGEFAKKNSSNNLWDEFVHTAMNTHMEFPELAVMLIAQSALETGWGETELFKKYNNPFGLNYDDFFSSIASPVQYEACDGMGTFAHFKDFKRAIRGYWYWFDIWDHYKGWRDAARKGPHEFLQFVIPHYCPPGMTEEWKAAHGGMDYPHYVVNKLMPEVKKILENK